MMIIKILFMIIMVFEFSANTAYTANNMEEKDLIIVKKDVDGKYIVLKNYKKVISRNNSKIDSMRNAIRFAKENDRETEVIVRSG